MLEGCSCRHCKKARDEIASLRAELAAAMCQVRDKANTITRLKKRVDAMSDYNMFHDNNEIARLTAENERLQFMGTAKDNANQVYAERNAELAAENERLSGLVAGDDLYAEIARLKAALEEIATGAGTNDMWAVHIARNALEGKEK